MSLQLRHGIQFLSRSIERDKGSKSGAFMILHIILVLAASILSASSQKVDCEYREPQCEID